MAKENIVYLIEKIWTDMLENHLSNAVGYSPYGFTNDEEKAKEFCSKGRMYTKKDCWAIDKTMPEFCYKPLNKIEENKI